MLICGHSPTSIPTKEGNRKLKPNNLGIISLEKDPIQLTYFETTANKMTLTLHKSNFSFL